MDNCLFPKDEIIQFVTSALKDPHNPGSCSGSLVMAIRLLTPATSGPTDKEEFRKMNKLSRAIFQFITAPRPQTQLKSFMERFSTCEDCAKVAGRTTGGATSPSPISTFFHVGMEEHIGKLKRDYLWFCSFVASKKGGDIYPANSCLFVTSAIRLLDLALAEVDFRSAAKGVSKLWPARISSLIPNGPEELVSSLLQWYRIHPDPVTLKFIGTITSLCRSLIHPTLIKHKFASIAADSTKHVLDLCLSTFASKDMLPDTLPLCDTYTQQSCAFFDVAQALVQEHLPGGVVLQLLNGCETKFVQLCSIILYLGPRSMRYMSMSMMANNGGAMPSMTALAQQKFHFMAIKPSELTSLLCRLLKTQNPNSPRPNIRIALPMVFRDRETYFGSEQGLEADIALASFWSNGINYGCYNRIFRGCRNSFEGLGTDLKVCDQCLGVFYCGHGCQSEDWKTGEHSHKQICPILRKIIHSSAGPNPGSSDATKTLQAKIKAADSDVTRIKAVRAIVRKARLSPNEMHILHGLGKRIYRALVLEKMAWSPGFDDYDACINQVTDRQRFAVAGSPEAATMTKTPSEEIKKQKSLLLAVRFWG
ncbi:hypothetical protein BJ165DRAFT_1425855 [Panaeolus papilionaceus]|nr:hypothetical protein BJ165DRAFT_1425855 [Panaeolus papilionaceus]